ncbi:MAG TPA: carboxymuconolactone decarboxylase family protein [Chitinophagaceae bacterium]|jgi:AhpD family alkylhydroperoxidase|nr:carboxymuconolactone decarboxylase family protein [Chitinophagaceae bacterium]
MEPRIDIEQVQPKAYGSMFGLEQYLRQSRLTTTHNELIKIRASQLNGCAFCLDLHTADALKNGESARRIFLLHAWKESGLFSEEEGVILAMTEEITLIHRQGLSDETYRKAEGLFTPEYLAQVIMAIVTINAWNRIAISTRKALKA